MRLTNKYINIILSRKDCCIDKHNWDLGYKHHSLQKHFMIKNCKQNEADLETNIKAS